MNPNYRSWNAYPSAEPARIVQYQRGLPLDGLGKRLLAFGNGRSYGDVCLNHQGMILDTQSLRTIHSLDIRTNTIYCGAGVRLHELLHQIYAQGRFLPVVPGTKFATVGGCIANDVHGKSQHRHGSFGSSVLQLELLRSDGKVHLCSREENPGLFAATIGGLGLTGIILGARLRLTQPTGKSIAGTTYSFHSLDEFYSLNALAKAKHEFIFSWLDGTRLDKEIRGFLLAGDWILHKDPADFRPKKKRLPPGLAKPLFSAPGMQLLHKAYWLKNRFFAANGRQDANRFFFPLDALGYWPSLYGNKGFLEYQCLVPEGPGERACVQSLLQEVARSACLPYLSALKRFEAQEFSGPLSFAGAGTSLIMDFPLSNPAVFSLMERMDALLLEAKGRVYVAKDARMSAETFRASYPALEEFQKHRDPAFSSSFSRRVKI